MTPRSSPFLRAAQGLLFLASSLLMSCRDVLPLKELGAVKSACSEGSKGCPSIEGIYPVIAKPGVAVTVFGENLTLRTKLLLEDRVINATFIDASTMSFVMPEGKSGFIPLAAVERGGKRLVLAGDDIKIYRRADAEFPVMTVEPGMVCDDVKYFDAEGELRQGTKKCLTRAACVSDGQIDCITTTDYPAAEASEAANKIISGQSLAGVSGNVTLPAAADVKLGTISYGEPGSLRVPSYSPDFPAIANVRANDTVDGVAGLLLDCAANAGVDCVANSTYKAADLRNLSAANIKAGVSIAGQVGDYPSATYTLPSASATADLDTATFNAKVKDATAFEYWDSAGVRHTGAGDADILEANIVSRVSIFGTMGAAPRGPHCNYDTHEACVVDTACRWTGSFCEIDPWNIRVGTTIAGKAGALKTSCRNRANATRWDTAVPQSVAVTTGTPGIFTKAGHGFTDNDTVRVGGTTAPGGITINNSIYYVRAQTADTFQLSTTREGASLAITTIGADVTVYKWADGTLNWWDTIDDYNNNDVYPTSLVSGWTSATDCDYGNWQDLTADGVCDDGTDNCIMKDRITGLMWSESYPVDGAAAASTTLNWQQALLHCNTLSFGGYTGWRLATQKELMEAYAHGIRDVGYNGAGTIRGSGSTHNNDQFILNVDATFWSASGVSLDARTWVFNPYFGIADAAHKKSKSPFFCVR